MEFAVAAELAKPSFDGAGRLASSATVSAFRDIPTVGRQDACLGSLHMYSTEEQARLTNGSPNIQQRKVNPRVLRNSVKQRGPVRTIRRSPRRKTRRNHRLPGMANFAD
jgi:hypothetical protein